MSDEAAAIAAVQHRFRESIWSTAPADAAQEMRIDKQRFGPILATAFAGFPDARLLNMAQGVAESGALGEGHLAAALEWLGSREVDYLVTVESGRPEAAAAEAWLAERGYEQGPIFRRYLRTPGDPGGADAPAVEVVELDASETEGMSLIFAAALELSDVVTVPLLNLPSLPDWRCYSAFLDGYEVACGAMLINDGIAMLGLDATAPQSRGHGCHSALIRRRLIDAEQAGCRLVVAETCDVGAEAAGASRNLERAGFSAAGRSVAWRRAAA